MKTIIEMAREVGIDWHRHWNDDESNRLEQFAALVRADLYKEMNDPLVLMCKQMVADEREACAKLCEDEGWTWAEKEAGKMYADAIRARGNT